MSENFKKSILEKIEHEHIKPHCKSSFICKEAGFWALYLLGILIGAIGFSMVIYALMTEDFDLFTELSGDGISMILSLFPIFWLICIILFLCISLFGIQHTRKGYKWPLYKLIGLNLLIGILLGSILIYRGRGERLDVIFEKSIPGYTSVMQRKMERWFQPQHGRLSGIIKSIDTQSKTFKIQEPDKNLWTVEYGDSIFHLKEGFNKELPVRILGEMTAKGTFNARVIASFHKFSPERIKNDSNGYLERERLMEFKNRIEERLHSASDNEKESILREAREEFKERFGK